MLSGKNLIRDSLCLIALVFLVRHAFIEQYIKHASKTTLLKHAVSMQAEQVKTHASKTAAQVAKRLKKTVRSVTGSKHVQFEADANTLLQQLSTAQEAVEKTDLLSDKEKTTLALDIKTVRSRIEHLKRESNKEPQELGLLSGPALSNARVVHKRSLDKKLLQATNNTGDILLTLHNELLGKDKKINPATSVPQGLHTNNSLLV